MVTPAPKHVALKRTRPVDSPWSITPRKTRLSYKTTRCCYGYAGPEARYSRTDAAIGFPGVDYPQVTLRAPGPRAWPPNAPAPCPGSPTSTTTILILGAAAPGHLPPKCPLFYPLFTQCPITLNNYYYWFPVYSAYISSKNNIFPILQVVVHEPGTHQ